MTTFYSLFALSATNFNISVSQSRVATGDKSESWWKPLMHLAHNLFLTSLPNCRNNLKLEFDSNTVTLVEFDFDGTLSMEHSVVQGCC